MRRRGFILALAILALAGAAPAGAQAGHAPSSHATPAPRSAPPVSAKAASPGPGKSARAAGDFDYYLLALSWSPTFCAGKAAASRAPEQCGPKTAYGLIAHGLWPQYETGYPIDCPVSAAPNAETLKRASAATPSRSLLTQEWRRHGGCSGLAPDAYFDKLDKAYAAITSPPGWIAANAALHRDLPALRGEFLKANPAVPANALTLQCHNGQLQSVRVCLSKGLKPRACSAEITDSCPPSAILVPAIGRSGARADLPRRGH